MTHSFRFINSKFQCTSRLEQEKALAFLVFLTFLFWAMFRESICYLPQSYWKEMFKTKPEIINPWLKTIRPAI